MGSYGRVNQLSLSIKYQDRQIDRQKADMTKLIVAFRNFANTPNEASFNAVHNYIL
jgi:hypothetical protein